MSLRMPDGPRRWVRRQDLLGQRLFPDGRRGQDAQLLCGLASRRARCSVVAMSPALRRRRRARRRRTTSASEDASAAEDAGAVDGSCAPAPGRASASTRASSRRASASSAAYVESERAMYVFGGSTAVPPPGERPPALFTDALWRFDDACTAWEEVNASGGPSARGARWPRTAPTASTCSAGAGVRTAPSAATTRSTRSSGSSRPPPRRGSS